MTQPEAPPAHGRAGRNLPAAIGVGVALGAIVLTTLFVYKPAFIVFLIIVITYGTYELAKSLRVADIDAPVVPLLAGAVAMDVTAYRRGPEELVVALLLTVVAIAVWRLLDGPEGYLGDVAACAIIAVYVPFLAGFASLLVAGIWLMLLSLLRLKASSVASTAVPRSLSRYWKVRLPTRLPAAAFVVSVQFL